MPLVNSDRSEPPPFQAHRRPDGRPWPITALCIGLALLLAWAWGHALGGGTARAFGRGYWLYLGTTSAALTVALWGLWRLRGWAR
jgi:hypothetical protein